VHIKVNFSLGYGGGEKRATSSGKKVCRQKLKHLDQPKDIHTEKTAPEHQNVTGRRERQKPARQRGRLFTTPTTGGVLRNKRCTKITQKGGKSPDQKDLWGEAAVLGRHD